MGRGGRRDGGTTLRYDLPTAVRGTLASPGSMLDAADFDGDGLSELVSGGSRVKVFRCRTKGPSTSAMVTVEPKAVGTTRVVGDFDGDGRADLAVRSYRGETKDSVAVFSGTKKGLLTAEPTVISRQRRSSAPDGTHAPHASARTNIYRTHVQPLPHGSGLLIADRAVGPR